jgi:Pilus formation protein N terminal region
MIFHIRALCPLRNRRFTIAVQTDPSGFTFSDQRDGIVMSRISKIAAGALSLSLILSAAARAEELVIKSDETQLVKVPGAIGTIVIGNPSIADATLENGNLFVQGKAFGSTNMIVLDVTGNQIANYSVTVQLGGNNNVALFSAGQRYSYVCAPLCEAAMQPGDPNKYVTDLVGLNEAKGNLAKGISNQDSNGGPSNGGGGGSPQ